MRAQDQVQDSLEILAGVERQRDRPLLRSGECDSNVRLQVPSELILELSSRRALRSSRGVGVRFRARAPALRNLVHDSSLELANAQTVFDRDARQLCDPALFPQSQQGSPVPRRELALLEQPSHRCRQGEQAEQIRHSSSILSDHIRDFLLCKTEDSCEIGGVGFAGVKGFAGGFGRGALGSWGEPAIKAFVQEAVNESIKLETALARLRTERRVVLMHYSPILATVEGEPREIFPYLGCSRLEEPLSRYPVDVVFHGHAHRGQPEGRTLAGVPVFNVSLPLQRRLHPDGPACRLFEIPVGEGGSAVPEPVEEEVPG